MPSSPTIGASWDGLVQRLNQVLLDGTVDAVMASGDLVVSIQGRSITTRALIDHPFQPGEAVVLARTDQDALRVLGVGTSGTIGGANPAPMPPSSAFVSPTLHDAILRLVRKRNQVLREGEVAAVLADGTLWVQTALGPRAATAETTQIFSAGHTVHAIQDDDGHWRVAGSTTEAVAVAEPEPPQIPEPPETPVASPVLTIDYPPDAP